MQAELSCAQEIRFWQSAMPFSVIHTNDVVEVRHQPLGDRDAAVVCIFGNTATWNAIHDDWPESCAPYAAICITARDRMPNQTKYRKSEFDPDGAHPDDRTGSDESYTCEVLSGVLPVLLQAVASKR